MAWLLLRAALAFAFLYPAYGFWRSPDNWIGYVPPFVKNSGVSEGTLLLGLAVFHVVLALWLLSGWRGAVAASVAAAFLVGVVVFNLNQFDVLFRDVSLALAALALALHGGDSFRSSQKRTE